MIGQQNLNASKSALTTSMERLSSGLRINSAKDDAAGQAIANRMSSSITGLATAQRNANDGISVAQTAEGALNQVNDNLQRIRELSVQAQNGTNSDSDLESIQNEIGQRLNEINRISEETDFNGVKVLSEGISPISIQVGANDGEAISIDLETINQNTLSLDNFDITSTLSELSAGDGQFSSAAVSFTKADMQANASDPLTDVNIDSTATGGTRTITDSLGADLTENDFQIRQYDGKNYAIGVANSADGKVFEISTSVDASDNLTITLGNEVTGDLASAAGDKGTSFSFNAGTSGLTIGNQDISLLTDGTDKFARVEAGDGTVSYYNVTSTGTASASGDVSVTLGAAVTNELNGKTLDPMETLDDALSKVDALRSDLGAIQNRFDSAITNLSTTETNLSAARSRIEDADYATEVANMTRAQILQQAGTSVLAQANQVPQSVLSLLG
ncbi:FliC/FljB family flagellin [Halomonas sp. OfavH-34-E]|nr:FliC/FljB family flagellin [Halomonas sp. OfavH-34-E]